MAMGVDSDAGRVVAEADGIGLPAQQSIKELFEEKASGLHLLRVLEVQFEVLLNEHRIAGGFQKDNRQAGLLVKQPQVVPAVAGSEGKVSLAKGRSAAALPAADNSDLKPSRFQQQNGRLANVRFVVTDEGIIPEQDLAAAAALRSAASKPSVETL
jgi:hypothetical protein